MDFPPVVSAESLRSNVADVVVADVRWYLDGRSGRAAYESGHIPGAVWIDVDTDLSAPATPEGGRHPLPTPEHFAAALGAKGIPDDAIVVAYDDAGGSHAARLVWLLRIIGQPAAVLDGGLEAWRATEALSGGELVPGPLVPGTETRPAATRRPVPWPADRFATADDLLAAKDDPATVVLDARASDRYTGEANAAVDARHGHVPGAASAPWATNLREDGRFLPAETLRIAYEHRGVVPDTTVIAYCGSGVTACHDLLALERAGVADGKLYPGSWSAWGADESLPIATGSDPLA
jgi:thiosulfate/3-mercaptopyruvate sulfurtransferase